MGMDNPQIPMLSPRFMLAPHSMTNPEYNSWRSGVSYAERLLEGFDNEEFNISHLMPSLTVQVCAQTLVLLLSVFLFLS